MSVRDDAKMTPLSAPLSVCVLASGSAGNCTVVATGDAGGGVFLVDLGLSPRRTAALLADMGLSLSQVRGVCVSHFDHDHVHAGWARASLGAPVYVHVRHARAARRAGLEEVGEVRHMTEGFTPCAGVEVRTVLNVHDESGTVAFRFERGGASLGFATDLGRVSDSLVSTMRGVDVLAIESNYCPELQAASARPAFLKQRIMGGSGHLSNHQAAAAVAAIEPRDHVVFLHLSRECNHPERVSRLHEGADYGFTISTQHAPTRWIGVGRGVEASRAAGAVLSGR